MLQNNCVNIVVAGLKNICFACMHQIIRRWIKWMPKCEGSWDPTVCSSSHTASRHYVKKKIKASICPRVHMACVIPWESELHSPQVSPRGRGSVRNEGYGFITVDLLLAVVGVCVRACACISCRKHFLTNEMGDVHIQWTRKAWGPSDDLRKKFCWHVWSDWLKRRGSAVAWGFDSDGGQHIVGQV